MAAKVADIIKIMEDVAPAGLAEAWDNVGLQIGQAGWPVRRIWISLDPAPDVVALACQKDADLLITHHPLIFKPLTSIDTGTSVGAIIRMALHHQLAIFAAHTNLDSAAGGLNDRFARRLGLKHVTVLGKPEGEELYKYTLQPDGGKQGLGRVGDLEKSLTLSAFAKRIKRLFKIDAVRITGKPDMRVQRVALCTGSGSGLLNRFLTSGADVFITGDIRYHDARAAETAGLGIIDIGHFASERLMINELAERLEKILIENGISAKINKCNIEKDPFAVV